MVQSVPENATAINEDISLPGPPGDESPQSLTQEQFDQFWDSLAEEKGSPGSPEGEDALEEESPEARYERAVAETRTLVTEGKASHREILRKILEFCTERRELGVVETEIQTYPEYAYAAQNPYRLMLYLEDTGALLRYELDESGAVVDETRKQGLTEDEIDDLVVTYAFETSDAGKEVADGFAPQQRITQLINQVAERAGTYRDVLDFCRTPQSMSAIDSFLKSKDVAKFTSLNTGSSVALKPSVFVDKLERAGGLVWNDGWKLTREGRAFLEAALQK